MLKRNIAKAMAAATVLTTAAPMANVVFADVVNNNQAEEIKALKEKVYELLNTKYTDNPALRYNDTDNQAAIQPAGNLYSVVIGVDVKNGKVVDAGGTEVTTAYESYAAFEKAFDAQFSKLSNGQKVVVGYTAENTRKLEDGTVVDFEEIKQGTITDVASLDANANGEGTISKALETYLGKISFSKYADGKTFARLPISGGYITVKEGDVKLNLDHPKFKVVDGYYVDANNNPIKKFIEANLNNADQIKELIALGGVVIGYYPLATQQEADSDSDIIAIVKSTEAVQKEELTVGDLYDRTTGRLTVKGNELVKALNKVVADEKNDIDKDNLKVTMTSIDKNGVAIDSIDTEESKVSLEELQADFDITNAVKLKVVFSTTGNENDADQDEEWTPAYEATITTGRNESFVELGKAMLGYQDMIVAAGMNRYETAVEASMQGWTDGELATNGTVVLVSGAEDKIVDGLTATPLAAKLNSPVLLTKQNELPKETINEIERLGAKNVIIVGGEGAVSTEIESKLAKTYGLKVSRLAGDSRYSTSMKVANYMASLEGDNKYDQVFVVAGNGEADALSISAVAGELTAPILLNPSAKLDTEVKHFINKNVDDDDTNTDVYIIGGMLTSGVQSELVDINVTNELGNHIEVKRLAGDGRQDTNAAVIKEFAETIGATNVDKIVVAKSDNKGMVDALAAGALAAKLDAHIVLATNELTESQEDALELATKVVSTNGTEANKVQVGYNVGSSVVKFLNKVFPRWNA